MPSPTCIDESSDFAGRLCSALLAAGQPIGATAFSRAYNAQAGSVAVTPHAARKWLNGEAVPTHQKVVILARWLNVQAWWLCFGGPESERYNQDQPGSPTLSRDNSVLIHDVMSLPATSQTVIRGIVDVFMRALPEGNGKVVKRRKP